MADDEEYRVLRKGTLAHRVTIVSATLLGAVAVSGAVLVWTSMGLRWAQQRQSEVFTVARQSTTDLLGAYVDQETGLRGYVITGQPTFLAPYTAAQPRIPVIVARLRTLTGRVPGAPGRLAAVQSAYGEWDEYASAQLAQVAAGDRAGPAGTTAALAGKTRFDALRDRVGDLQAVLQADQDANQATVVGLQQRLVVLLIASLLVLAGVMVTGTRVLLDTIARPVRDLAAAARAVSQGDLSAPIPEGGAPEIRAMAGDVRAMRDRLLADAHSAERALQALEQHGPAVTALREALIPGAARIPGVMVAGRMDPAEGILAGDWYDLIALSEHRLAVVLGDVAGHGPRSAVLALRLKHALAASLRAGADPAGALAATSRTLHDLPDELFATVLVVAIDTTTDTLSYANAGHPAALLLNRPARTDLALNPGERATPVTSHHDRTRTWIDLPSTGPLLSPVVASWSWAQADHTFHPDDTLIAFTDGLLEARNPDGEQFGLTRLLDTINAYDLTDGPRLLDAVAAAVTRHTTSRRDDQTLVYARRAPARPART